MNFTHFYSLPDRVLSWRCLGLYHNVRLEGCSRGHIYNQRHVYNLRDKTMCMEEVCVSKGPI